MSEIRVNNIKNEAGSGAPQLTYGASIPVGYGLTGAGGINITGVATAGSFSGNLTGNATGLSGTPNITVGTIGATSLNASGVVTATSFVGAVTGNVTGNLTGNVTGNATGLSGTPNITVGNATVTGDLTVQGTTTTIDTVNLVIEDKNIGIGSTSTPSNTTADGGGLTIFGGSDGDKTLTYNDTKKAFETNIAFAPNENRFITGSEKITRVDGNTVTLTYAGSSSNVAICTNPSGNITLNVVGIPTISSFDNHALTFSVIVQQTGTARTCIAVTLNGVSRTVKFAGGSLANALSGVTTTSGYTIQSFTGINTVGSASTTTNYEVFGIVSGGFF